jgi:hypothetical protein
MWLSCRLLLSGLYSLKSVIICQEERQVSKTNVLHIARHVLIVPSLSVLHASAQRTTQEVDMTEDTGLVQSCH